MEEIRQKLMESIFEVFERMLFVFLEPLDESGSISGPEASIHFDSDNITGTCRLMVDQSLATIMAQNLMGDGCGELDKQCVGDCVKEALNMISGNFLSKYDRSRVFNLSIPELSDGAMVGTASQVLTESDYQLYFDSDYGKVSMSMSMSL